MSVDEIESPPELDKKTKKPKRYKVILYDKYTLILPCHLCVLRDVFNMTENEALQKMALVQKFGSAAILTNQSKDVAETKAEDANREKEYKATICLPSVQSMNFVAEPEYP